MKKLLLLGLAASTAAVAGAQAVVGGSQCFREGYTLSNVWANDANLAIPQMDIRSGVGTNDNFYVIKTNYGPIYQFGKEGLLKEIALPEGLFSWVTTTGDEAGNAIIRVDKSFGFSSPKPNGQNNGGFTTGSTPGFLVISPEGEIVRDFIPMTCEFGYRADVLGNIRGNILEGENESVFVVGTSNRARNGVNEFCYNKGEFVSMNNSPVFIELVDKNPITIFTEVFPDCATMQTSTTTASAVAYGDALAVFLSPYSPESSSNGKYGNSIERWERSDEEAMPWKPTGQFFVTPQHSFMGGFNVFSINGKDYIIYSSGQSGATVAADAFAISEVVYTDTPATTPDQAASDKEKALVARVYAGTDEIGNIKYKANTGACPVYNVLPDPEDENSVHIYMYCSGAPMAKWKFTVPAKIDTGVEGIETVEDNAPVEYFNLQGVRVSNPENGGLYIKRQGAKAEKVIL